MLNVLDEFTHECLAIRVARKLKAIDVIDVLSELFILRGVPRSRTAVPETFQDGRWSEGLRGYVASHLGTDALLTARPRGGSRSRTPVPMGLFRPWRDVGRRGSLPLFFGGKFRNRRVANLRRGPRNVRDGRWSDVRRARDARS